MSLHATGKYLPNRWVFHFREALSELLGREGAENVIRAIPNSIDDPTGSAQNLEKSFDFSRYAAICASVSDVYGEEGAQTILRRAGHDAFTRMLKSTATIVGVERSGLPARPASESFDSRMQSIVRLWGLLSDMQCACAEAEGEYRFRIFACPECAGRTAAACLCHSMVGMLQAALDWFRASPTLTATEIQCMSQGAPQCEFALAKIS
jgi:predicted hydrocarbon binding protein